ncbi:hypothetical protein VAL01S_07_01540 [Vibrio alginolyticus NBRC 15630 = ATCC 17749]|nr:hypothetical protein YZOS03_40400 [Vibrio alginolyticus]BCG19472.1 hypothetical protein HLBS07_33240 [Vibrio alginolyticus]GAD71357.1 hypothetical protein VAL01S_07_01540 [Vibrio alginolyticus NBRC 15630 = ATCC 17749]
MNRMMIQLKNSSLIEVAGSYVLLFFAPIKKCLPEGGDITNSKDVPVITGTKNEKHKRCHAFA